MGSRSSLFFPPFSFTWQHDQLIFIPRSSLLCLVFFMFMRQWRFGDFVAKIVFVFPPFLFTWQHDQPIFISKVFPCFFKFFYVSAAAEVRGFWCQDRLCFFSRHFCLRGNRDLLAGLILLHHHCPLLGSRGCSCLLVFLAKNYDVTGYLNTKFNETSHYSTNFSVNFLLYCTIHLHKLTIFTLHLTYTQT